MSLRIYEYQNCSTCKNALKYLDGKRIKYEKIPIVDQPPTMKELREMLDYLKRDGKSFKNLFNTSGVQYRELKIGDEIKSGMTEDEALSLLAKNGKLVKRPFVLGRDFGLLGFKQTVWDEHF